MVHGLNKRELNWGVNANQSIIIFPLELNKAENELNTKVKTKTKILIKIIFSAILLVWYLCFISSIQLFKCIVLKSFNY